MGDWVPTGRRDPPDRVPRKPPRRGGTPTARLVPFSCRQARRTREKSRAPCVATEARAPPARARRHRPQRLGARRALVRLRLNCGDQKHPMFDRRDVRSVSQERLSRRGGDETRAARSFSEKKRSARFFTFFVERNARSFWLFTKTRVSERHRLALDAGTHPSVLPVLPGRGGRWLTRHARLQHHRRALHEPLRANLRRAVAHGARSVRVYLPRSKNSRETTWAR